MNELNIFIIGSASLVLNVLSNRPALMLLDNTNSSRWSSKETSLRGSYTGVCGSVPFAAFGET